MVLFSYCALYLNICLLPLSGGLYILVHVEVIAPSQKYCLRMPRALVPQRIYYGEDAVKHIFREEGEPFPILALFQT